MEEIVAMDYTCDDSAPREPLNSVITWLCRDPVFSDFFSLRSDYVARKLLFERLQTYLEGGHDLVLVLAQEDTKNNLMWNFRRWVVKIVGTSAALNELDFTTNIINKDANNYHVWSHRRWVFQTFGEDWEDEDELAYCAKILEGDPYNRFAWDQRYFVITRWVPKIYEAKWNMLVDPVRYEKVVTLEENFEGKRSKEAEYALGVICAEPENQYPWSHIKGLYDAYPGLLCSNILVREGVLHVLEDERDRVHGLKVDDITVGRVAFSMNGRGVINALNMVLEFLETGYFHDLIMEEQGQGKRFRNVINDLCPDSCLCDLEYEFGFLDKVYSLMERMEESLSDCGISWGNAGEEVLWQRFVCIDYTRQVHFDKTDV